MSYSGSSRLKKPSTQDDDECSPDSEQRTDTEIIESAAEETVPLEGLGTFECPAAVCDMMDSSCGSLLQHKRKKHPDLIRSHLSNMTPTSDGSLYDAIDPNVSTEKLRPLLKRTDTYILPAPIPISSVLPHSSSFAASRAIFKGESDHGALCDLLSPIPLPAPYLQSTFKRPSSSLSNVAVLKKKRTSISPAFLAGPSFSDDSFDADVTKSK